MKSRDWVAFRPWPQCAFNSRLFPSGGDRDPCGVLLCGSFARLCRALPPIFFRSSPVLCGSLPTVTALFGIARVREATDADHVLLEQLISTASQGPHLFRAMNGGLFFSKCLWRVDQLPYRGTRGPDNGRVGRIRNHRSQWRKAILFAARGWGRERHRRRLSRNA